MKEEIGDPWLNAALKLSLQRGRIRNELGGGCRPARGLEQAHGLAREHGQGTGGQPIDVRRIFVVAAHRDACLELVRRVNVRESVFATELGVPVGADDTQQHPLLLEARLSRRPREARGLLDTTREPQRVRRRANQCRSQSSAVRPESGSRVRARRDRQARPPPRGRDSCARRTRFADPAGVPR